MCLFVNSVNVKGQCLYFINTIFNHNLVQNASFILFFHQGKQQHTLVLGQASNQVVTFLKVKGQGQIGIPPKSQKMRILCISLLVKV